MPADPKNETVNKVVFTNISCMKTLLEKALLTVVEADKAADTNERNLAIGTLMELEASLVAAKALFDATLVVHRHG